MKTSAQHLSVKRHLGRPLVLIRALGLLMVLATATAGEMGWIRFDKAHAPVASNSQEWKQSKANLRTLPYWIGQNTPAQEGGI